MSDAAHPILVLRARAEARAMLYGFGEFSDIEQATEPLRLYAVRAGILDMLGREAVEIIILDPLNEHGSFQRRLCVLAHGARQPTE
jgi:hypothetical protein